MAFFPSFFSNLIPFYKRLIMLMPARTTVRHHRLHRYTKSRRDGIITDKLIYQLALFTYGPHHYVKIFIEKSYCTPSAQCFCGLSKLGHPKARCGVVS